MKTASIIIAVALALISTISAQDEIIPPKNQLQTDAETLLAAVKEVAEANSNLISKLTSTYNTIWSIPPERLAPLLNQNVNRSQNILSHLNALSNAVNARMDDLNSNKYPNRAPTGFPEGWSFAGGVFVYTPPEE